MYVIFPAEEVVYFTYEGDSVRHVTLERPVPAAARAPPPAEKTRAKLLKKLGKPNDADFGRITRSPDPVDFDQPAPLPTPAFSRKNIFDRDFDALFEVAHAPLFSENVRVVTPEPRRRHDVTAASFRAPSLPPSPRVSLVSEQNTSLTSEPRASFISDPRASLTSEQRRSPTPPPPPSPRRPPSRQHSKDSLPPTEEHSSANSSCRSKKVSFFRRLSRAVAGGVAGGAAGGAAASTMAGEAVLRDLAHPAYNEQLKNHNNGSFKLVKTVSDFTSQLSQIYEQHSSELAALVATFRKRNAELRKERTPCPSSLFHTWETLLQEVEADAVGASTAASALDRQVGRPLVEKTFHMKLQSRKLFAHRDGCEAILVKADEKLTKSRTEYKNAHATCVTAPSPGALGAYYDAHNAYVQQLAATNGMLDQYHRYTLPTILQELEEIYGDLCNTLTDAIYQESEVITSKCNEQYRRYESLGVQSRAVSSTADLAHLARAISTVAPPAQRALRRAYAPPVEADAQPEAENQPPSLKNEVILDRVGAQQARLSYETLKKDAVDLELQIKQLQDSLDALARIQTRGLEGSLYNKVNEIQEDISMKKYDYRAAQLHLAAIRAQKELFAARADGNVADRKLSSSSTGSMKNKWLKAFRSLKPAPSPQPPPVTGLEKRNGSSGRDNARVPAETDAHNFQEYTYKKITPCDVCSQVLRGHTRQGLRCRLCKMNVHVDCMSSVGKCQTKSRLLRRQKSTSEIESRIQDNVLEEEKSEDTTTRPFGQPLCFVKENGDPSPAPLTSKESMRKKK